MRKAIPVPIRRQKPQKTAARPTKPASKTDAFTLLCRKELQIETVKEFRFHPTRLWRFDYAIPEKRIAIEVEGGVYKKRRYISKRTGEMITTVGGRHNSAEGFLGDMEKYNAAALLGWRVFRAQPSDLLTNATINTIKEAIKAGEFVFFAEKCV